MAELKAPQTTTTPNKRSAFSKHVTGTVSNFIGTGRPAQESIVWLTIQRSFLFGIVMSTALVLFVFFKGETKASFPIDEIKSIWSIFVPLITLALGYIFGRGG